MGKKEEMFDIRSPRSKVFQELLFSSVAAAAITTTTTTAATVAAASYSSAAAVAAAATVVRHPFLLSLHSLSPSQVMNKRRSGQSHFLSRKAAEEREEREERIGSTASLLLLYPVL